MLAVVVASGASAAAVAKSSVSTTDARRASPAAYDAAVSARGAKPPLRTDNFGSFAGEQTP